jgi:hypothetical protein
MFYVKDVTILASVFITRATQDGPNAELELHRLVPIVHDFAISTAQKKQGSWDRGLPLWTHTSGPSALYLDRFGSNVLTRVTLRIYLNRLTWSKSRR